MQSLFFPIMIPILFLIALTIYCWRQEPKAPFLGAAAAGAVGGAVIGSLILGSYFGWGPDDNPVGLILWPPIGAAAGAYSATAFMSLVVDPRERRIGVRLGALGVFLMACPLLLLVPQSRFVYSSSSSLPSIPTLLIAACLLGSLVGAHLGAGVPKRSAETNLLLRKIVSAGFVIFLVVDLLASRRIYLHIVPAGTLERAGDLAGLRYKIATADAPVRPYAIASFARLAPMEALQHPDKLMQLRGALVLGTRNDARALRVLETALWADPSAPQRPPMMTHKEWQKKQDEIRQRDQAYYYQRYEAVEVLARMNDPQARQILEKARSSPDVRIRELVVNALLPSPVASAVPPQSNRKSSPEISLVAAPLRQWNTGKPSVPWIAFSPQGTILASVGHNWTPEKVESGVELWNARTGKHLRILAGDVFFDGQCSPFAFSPDGKTLASLGKGEIKLWSLATGALRKSLPTGPALTLSLAFTPDSKTLAASTGSKLTLWDVASGQSKQLNQGNEAPVNSLACPSSGSLLASGVDVGTISIWDTDTQKLVRSWTAHKNGEGWAGPVTVAISADGKTVASIADEGASRDAKLWDATTGTLQHVLKAEDNALSAAFSPDGRTLATGHSDYKVRLWDTRTGALKQWMPTAERPSSTGTNVGVHSIAFSPDGTLLASGDNSGLICLWRVK